MRLPGRVAVIAGIGRESALMFARSVTVLDQRNEYFARLNPLVR